MTQQLSKDATANEFLNEIEDKFTKVADEINKKGLVIDTDKLAQKVETLMAQKQEFQDKVTDVTGLPYDTKSASHKRAIIEECCTQLCLEPIKTEKGQISVSMESIEELLIQAYDSNVDNMYVDVLRNTLDAAKLHNPATASSKMFAYINPNTGNTLHPVMTVKDDDNVSRVFFTNPSLSELNQTVRECIKAHEGKKFVYIDWSGAELYIQAYLAKEETLLKVFENHEDPHKFIAHKLLGMPIEEITDDDRKVSKIVAFATSYGSEGGSVAKALDISVEKAREYIAKFYEIFPNIDKLRKSIIQKGLSTGYTSDIFCRHRSIPELLAVTPKEIATGKRKAYNTYIQNSCGDLFKIAANRTLEMDNVDYKLGIFDAHLLEVPENMSDDEVKQIADKLSDFSDILPNFKFNYKLGTGNYWGDAEP